MCAGFSMVPGLAFVSGVGGPRVGVLTIQGQTVSLIKALILRLELSLAFIISVTEICCLCIGLPLLSCSTPNSFPFDFKKRIQGLLNSRSVCWPQDGQGR